MRNSIISTMQQLQGWGHQQGLHPKPAGSIMSVPQPCVPPVPPTTRPPPPAPRSPSFLPVQLQLPSGAGSQDMWQDGSRADFVPAACPLLAFPAASTLQLGSTTGRGNARVTRCRRGKTGSRLTLGVLLPHAALLSDRLHFFPLSHKSRAGAGGGPRAVARPLPHRHGPGMSYEERAPRPGLRSRAQPRGRQHGSLRRAVFLPFPPRTVLQPQQGPPGPTTGPRCCQGSSAPHPFTGSGRGAAFTPGEQADGLLTASGTPCSSCGDSRDPLLPISIHTS